MSLNKMKQNWAAQRQRQERQLFEVIEIPYDGLKLRMEVTSDSDDHDMHFDLVNENGQASSQKYRYSGAEGKILQNGKYLGAEWIGMMSVSYGICCRAATVVKILCNHWGLPDTLQGLNRLIAKRGPDREIWRLALTKPEKGKPSQMGLVHLSGLAHTLQDAGEERGNPDGAVISQVAIALQRQRQGFGLLMHVVVAGYLKERGYKYLQTDMVGMNTDGEIAVWAAMENKGFPVESFTENYELLRFMLDNNFINDVLYDYTSKSMDTYMGGELMSMEKAEKTEFPQYEMDLTQMDSLTLRAKEKKG